MRGIITMPFEGMFSQMALFVCVFVDKNREDKRGVVIIMLISPMMSILLCGSLCLLIFPL